MDVIWGKSQICVTSMRFRCLLLLAASFLLRPPRPACSVVLWTWLCFKRKKNSLR